MIHRTPESSNAKFVSLHTRALKGTTGYVFGLMMIRRSFPTGVARHIGGTKWNLHRVSCNISPCFTSMHDLSMFML